jgi:Spy/CpxP family protein refolding chaperone
MSSGISGVGSTPYLITAANTGTDSLAAATAQNAIDPFADPNGPFANLNLTAQQQAQIQSIFSSNSQSGNQAQTPTQLFQQVENVLTPQQQAQLKTDLETLSAHHHHHHHGGESGANSLLSQLDLSSTQQSQITSILQSAQSSGTSASGVLGQIDNVLTPAQQQQLVALLSPNGTSATSSTGTPSLVINTNA